MPRPTGPQFVRVFHTSWKETPPHENNYVEKVDYEPGDNEHPDIIHMGTRRSALHFHRPYLHEYEIDTSAVEPVVYSDEPYTVTRTDRSKNPDDSAAKNWKQAMAGKQEGLWETVDPDIEEAATQGRVIPYRNRIEDAGSISYAVSKKAIQSGKVRHVGVTNFDSDKDLRRKMEKEEKMYE